MIRSRRVIPTITPHRGSNGLTKMRSKLEWQFLLGYGPCLHYPGYNGLRKLRRNHTTFCTRMFISGRGGLLLADVIP